MSRSGASKGAKNIKPFDEQNTKLAQGFIKKVGEEVGVDEFIRGAQIIDQTETNPLKKYLRLQRMRKNTPLKGA